MLLENRVRRVLDDDEHVCEHHRNSLGMYWRQPRLCLHPDHPSTSNGKGAPPSCRVATLSMTKHLNQIQTFSFPIGGKMCMTHRKLESKPKSTEVGTPGDNMEDAGPEVDEVCR